METYELDPEQITLDPYLQMRVSVSSEAIEDYKRQIELDYNFPPITCMQVDDKLYLLDGWHRLQAHNDLGRETIDAHVLEGTYEDAKDYVIKANSTHGLRRTAADKRRVIETMLSMDKYKKATLRELEMASGVPRSTIARIKNPPKAKESKMSQWDKEDSSDKQQRSDLVEFDSNGTITDKIGQPITNTTAVETWIKSMALAEYAAQIKLSLKSINASDSTLYPWLNYGTLRSAAVKLFNQFENAIPHALCPFCSGDGCKRCNHCGWMPKRQYEDTLPKQE